MSDEKRFVYTRFFLVHMSLCFRMFTMILYNMFVTHVQGYGTVKQYNVFVMMKYCEYHISVFGLSLSAIDTTCTIRCLKHVKAQPFDKAWCKSGCVSQPVLHQTTESIHKQSCLAKAFGSHAAIDRKSTRLNSSHVD